MENLTERQPAVIVTMPDKVHVVPYRVLRECAQGRYMGCCAEMVQILAVAVLEMGDNEKTNQP